MKIAVQAADLDEPRVDGTRVYLLNLLRWMGGLAPQEEFILFHKRSFTPALTPPSLVNYTIKTKPFPVAWMQTRFAYELWKEKPDVLFLPVQAIPWWVSRETRVVVTIHDLAWKYFPKTFTFWQRVRLNLFLGLVVRRADCLIAVSEATRKDLLKYFPTLDAKKIRVIHHGFDREFFETRLAENLHLEILSKYRLEREGYLLFVGALQPRKNLVLLIQAFEGAKKMFPDMRLVLAGETAWLSEDILRSAKESPFADDIILTDRVSFEDIRALYQGARVFVFPSLYEGFGLPLLEAFASGTPVVTGKNSSLSEIAGDAALYADIMDVSDLGKQIGRIWSDPSLRKRLIERGRKRLHEFSWERCARETLEALR